MLSKIWTGFRRLALTFLVFGLLAGTGYAFLFQGEHEEVRILETRLARMTRDIDEENRRIRRLKLLIGQLRNSNQLLEKVAREDAGLIKDGEILYLFPESD
jgi:cell division protein FtsB